MNREREPPVELLVDNVPSTVTRSHQPTANFTRENAIARFTGTPSKIDAQSWIVMYERVSNGITDNYRIESLGSYLTDDSLSWYAQEIAVDLTLSWNDVRYKFLARYGTAIVPPGVAAEQCRMTS